MRNTINWMKKWTFVWLFLVCGVLFMRKPEYSRVYAEPLEELLASLGISLSGESAEGEKQSALPDWEEQTGEDTNAENVLMTQSANNTDGRNAAEQREPITGGSVESDTAVTGKAETESEQENTLPASRLPEEVVYETVENDYFADALFIGDSRTVGLYDYAGLEDTAQFYASTGLTVYKLFTEPIVQQESGEKITVEEALTQQSFGKIYLMIGINEMGTGTVDTFMAKYSEALQHLRELQPEAIIYLESIMEVTDARSDQGDYITNEGIRARNEQIAALADNVSVYYLNVNEAVCEEDGGLLPEYTTDGVHLKARYIPLWLEYLKTHAADFSLLD